MARVQIVMKTVMIVIFWYHTLKGQWLQPSAVNKGGKIQHHLITSCKSKRMISKDKISPNCQYVTEGLSTASWNVMYSTCQQYDLKTPLDKVKGI